MKNINRLDFIKIAGISALGYMSTAIPYNNKLLSNIPLSGNIYYVSSTGNDSNFGTIDKPWQTITRVNTATLYPNDVVLFKCGDVFPGMLSPRISGVSGFFINYGAYGEGPLPVIDGTAYSALYIDNINRCFLRFENLDLAGSNGAVNTLYCGAHDIDYYNLIVRDSGVSKSGASVNNSYNINFDHVRFHHNWGNGLLAADVTNHDILVRYCESDHNGHIASHDHGFYVAGGILLDYCSAHDNFYAGFKENDNEQEAFYYPVVRNSWAYNNVCGLYVTHKNATYYNNLVENNSEINMGVLGNAWGGYRIIHNTFANSRGANARTIIFAAGVSPRSVIKNNLFIQDMSLTPRGIFESTLPMQTIKAYYDIDYNEYYTNGNPISNKFAYIGADIGNELKSWNNWHDIGLDIHSTFLTTLPDFVSRYTNLHPKDNGNLKEKGIMIVGFEIDKDGKIRHNPPTPGCYDTLGTIILTPTPTVTQTFTSTATATATNTATATPTNTATGTSTNTTTPTNSPSPTSTSTFTPTVTSTQIPTKTSTPKPTSTPTPTPKPKPCKWWQFWCWSK